MRVMLLVLSVFVFSLYANAQLVLKTEYFGKSSFRMQDGEHSKPVGDAEGSSIVYQGGINIPLSVKIDQTNRPKAWMLGAAASYVKLDNHNFTEDLVLDKILNYGLGISHIRPISTKWSFLFSVGAGVYTSQLKPGHLRFRNILGSASTLFIYRVRPNLEVGGGLALNNSFGVPMLFPAFYLNWFLQGRFKVNISLKDGLALSTSYQLAKWFELGVAVEMNGQMAVVDRSGSDFLFTHQYLIVGLRPEIKLSKKISIPFTVGIHAMRSAEYKERSIKYMFKGNDFFFRGSPYCSAAFKMMF